jgi:hypothetical protein
MLVLRFQLLQDGRLYWSNSSTEQEGEQKARIANSISYF